VDDPPPAGPGRQTMPEKLRKWENENKRNSEEKKKKKATKKKKPTRDKIDQSVKSPYFFLRAKFSTIYSDFN
jgi:hypothetical protein